MTKRYTVPLKNALRLLSKGDGIGTEFMDHREWMVITAVGKPYAVGKEKLFDFYAEEKAVYERRQQIGEPPTPKEVNLVNPEPTIP